MSLEEKLAVIDQEIRTLHQFCISKGFDPYKIENEAQPLLSSIRNAKLSRQGTWLARGAIVVALLAILCQFDSVYRMLLLAGRLASIKVRVICKIFNSLCESHTHDQPRIVLETCSQVIGQAAAPVGK